MGIFELFLIAGSVICLVVAWGLFYENCSLAVYIVKLLNDNIHLTENAIEAQIDKIRLMREIDAIKDTQENKLIPEETDSHNKSNETCNSI